ncbi:tryptophan--tRNA ligase [Pelagibaculum spongiae]|uniref:tryptophan--tRNA ligase n=1 Tax=Pelagibaculum spongiae TaxID=2080658 RepID=A0A2V1H210_9GAMM|nr:tryptophan--tRNA ligase [Pelagibaculum spongiae]
MLSGMRPSGALHLGHFHGVLKNWLKFQHEYDCFFCVADWQALGRNFQAPKNIAQHIQNLVIDWLSVGIDPASAKIFLQSRVPEHAELHLLLSTITPLTWLERMPAFKEAQEANESLSLSDISSPLLKTTDILIYQAGLVTVSDEHEVHVELAREIARRFNHLYGRESDFEKKSEQAIGKMNKKVSKLYQNLRRSFQEQGNQEALLMGRALLEDQQVLTMGDRDRLTGYLEGNGRQLLAEPQTLVTKAARITGLDGRVMSRNYNNIISLRETSDSVEQKIRTMPTDSRRVRLTDPGDPLRCPVWPLHENFSDQKTCDWVTEGCTTAGIGCLECKKPLIDNINAQLEPIRVRAKEYEEHPGLVKDIIYQGSDDARDVARETLDRVRDAMGMVYY